MDTPWFSSSVVDQVTGDEQCVRGATTNDSEWYVPICLTANTGMRRGEVLGLSWRHVDLGAARLVVDQQILSVEYGAHVADVMTTNSRRTIDLDPRTDTVRTWRRQQLEQQMSTGGRDDGGFVFTRVRRSADPPDFFSWERLVRESKMRRVRLHDLRHTHASILLKAGFPVKVVSERLGHSSPAFTMTVYQHVLSGMKADAEAAFGQAVID